MAIEKTASEVAQKPANPTPIVSWERGRKKEILRLFFPPPSPLPPHSPFPQDTATFFYFSSSSFGFLASSFVGRWGGGGGALAF